MAALRLSLLRSFKDRKLNECLIEITRKSSCKNTSSKTADDKVTHTGQKWDKDDYRLARFENLEKHVNPNFAINLIKAVPPKPRKERVVWCDGESGDGLGHPRVYINLDKPGNHSCCYCGLRFYKDDHHC